MSRSSVSAWAMSTAVVILFASVASAQTSAAAAVPQCTTLLTAEEITKAVGVAMENMGAQVRESGESECPWMVRGGSSGFKTISVQFYDMKVIKASTTASTLPTFFELIVSAGESAAPGKKRELLPGIGQQAAFVPTDPQVFAVVQRADGVARIVANNLTKAQITAVARAVATP